MQRSPEICGNPCMTLWTQLQTRTRNETAAYTTPNARRRRRRRRSVRYEAKLLRNVTQILYSNNNAT